MKKLILALITSILIFTCILTTKKANADVTNNLNTDLYSYELLEFADNSTNASNINTLRSYLKEQIYQQSNYNQNAEGFFIFPHVLIGVDDLCYFDVVQYYRYYDSIADGSRIYLRFGMTGNSAISNPDLSNLPVIIVMINDYNNGGISITKNDKITNNYIYSSVNAQTTQFLFASWSYFSCINITNETQNMSMNWLGLKSMAQNIIIDDRIDKAYNSGYSEGQADGVIIGRSQGYQEGYQAGIESGETYYTEIQNFNQLVQNGNFAGSSGWSSASSQISVSNNILTIEKTIIYSYGRATTIVPRINGHKYFFTCKAKDNVGTGNIFSVEAYLTGDSGTGQTIISNKTLTSSWQTFSIIFTANSTSDTSRMCFYPDNQSDNVGNKTDLKRVMCFDLTLMFGEGNEPTLEQCNQIFTANYYNYTLSQPVDVGYFTGFTEGKNEGLQQGITIGETNQINTGFITKIWDAISGFLSIRIFPRISIGTLVMIPFILTFTGFIIGVIRKGGDKGGDDE